MVRPACAGEPGVAGVGPRDVSADARGGEAHLLHNRGDLPAQGRRGATVRDRGFLRRQARPEDWNREASSSPTPALSSTHTLELGPAADEKGRHGKARGIGIVPRVGPLDSGSGARVVLDALARIAQRDCARLTSLCLILVAVCPVFVVLLQTSVETIPVP